MPSEYTAQSRPECCHISWGHSGSEIRATKGSELNMLSSFFRITPSFAYLWGGANKVQRDLNLTLVEDPGGSLRARYGIPQLTPTCLCLKASTKGLNIQYLVCFRPRLFNFSNVLTEISLGALSKAARQPTQWVVCDTFINLHSPPQWLVHLATILL